VIPKIAKELTEVPNVIVGDPGIEKILTNSFELKNRSTWRTIGKRYHIGPFSVAVGVMEHGHNSTQPVMEIICLESNDRVNLNEIFQQMFEVARNLSPTKWKPGLKSYHNSFHYCNDNKDAFTIDDRGLQWISATESGE